MPTKDLSFNLVADANGKVTGSHDEFTIIPVTLEKVIVRSVTGCNGRGHPVTAGLSGGAQFDYNGSLIDCTDLEIPLGELVTDAFSTTTLHFELNSYDPDEPVTLSGTIHYSL